MAKKSDKLSLAEFNASLKASDLKMNPAIAAQIEAAMAASAAETAVASTDNVKLDSRMDALIKALKENTLALTSKTKSNQQSLGTDLSENQIEDRKATEYQTTLLENIEENTRGLGNLKGEEQPDMPKINPLLALGGLATTLAIALGAIIGGIKGYVKAIVAMNKALFPALNTVKDKIANIVNKVVLVFENIKNFVGNIVSKILNTKAVQTITGTFSKVVETVSEYFTKIKTVVTNFLEPIKKAFAVIEETSAPVSKITTGIKNSISAFGGKLTSIFTFFQEIGTKISIFGKLFGAVSKIASKLAFPLTIVMAVWDTVKGAIEGYEKEGIVGAISGAIKGLVGSILMAPLDLLKDGVSWLLSKFGFDDASKALDSFSFQETFNKFIDAVFHPIETIKGILESLGDWMSTIEIPSISILGKKFGPWKPFSNLAKDEKQVTGDTAIPLTKNVKAANVNNKQIEVIATKPDGTALVPAVPTVDANKVYVQSANNASAAMKPSESTTTIVNNAPVTNTSKQSAIIRTPLRNPESSASNYFQKVFSM